MLLVVSLPKLGAPAPAAAVGAPMKMHNMHFILDIMHIHFWGIIMHFYV